MQRESKLAGAFILFLGLFSLFTSVRILAFSESATGEGSSCKSICGITMLLTQFLSAEVGQIVGGLLWLCIAFPFIWFGYRLLWSNRHA